MDTIGAAGEVYATHMVVIVAHEVASAMEQHNHQQAEKTVGVIGSRG